MGLLILTLIALGYFLGVYGTVRIAAYLANPQDVSKWLEEATEVKKDKMLPPMRAAAGTEPCGVRPTFYETELM